jgi:hypothetical protein
MNIILVQLSLFNPNPKNPDAGLEVSLCFNDEPTAEHLFEAFQEVPTINKHPEFEVYRNRLFQCLETYGVPKLGKFNMVTPEGAPINVSMVYATWHLNLVAPNCAALGEHVGDIRISRRHVHNVVPPAPPDDEEGEAEDVRPLRNGRAVRQGKASQTAQAASQAEPATLTARRKARVR